MASPDLPDDLARALNDRAGAGIAFRSFPPSHRRRYIEWINEAKRPQTRAKRIVQAVEMIVEKADESRRKV